MVYFFLERVNFYAQYFLKRFKNWIRTVIRDIDYDLIVQASKKEAVVYKCPIKKVL